MFSHIGLVRPEDMPQQFPYMPTWQELRMARDEGVGTSGSHHSDDEEE